MASREWETASEIEWEMFYLAVEGRPLRDLFVEATPLLPTAVPGAGLLVAVDLGCGDGTETIELLRRGWTVLAVDGSPEGIARLRESVPAAARARLSTSVSGFTDVDLPTADLVYAGLSLPFCDPQDFAEVWRRVTSALRAGGLFVGHLFGPHDDWADTPDMSFQRVQRSRRSSRTSRSSRSASKTKTARRSAAQSIGTCSTSLPARKARDTRKALSPGPFHRP